MGSLGDGIEVGRGAGAGIPDRTPLGNRCAVTRFLHDGRSATLQEAVMAHDGQARKVRERFAALPGWKKNFLYAFLGSL